MKRHPAKVVRISIVSSESTMHRSACLFATIMAEQRPPESSARAGRFQECCISVSVSFSRPSRAVFQARIRVHGASLIDEPNIQIVSRRAWALAIPSEPSLRSLAFALRNQLRDLTFATNRQCSSCLSAASCARDSTVAPAGPRQTKRSHSPLTLGYSLDNDPNVASTRTGQTSDVVNNFALRGCP